MRTDKRDKNVSRKQKLKALSCGRWAFGLDNGFNAEGSASTNPGFYELTAAERPGGGARTGNCGGEGAKAS
jgi:hypothetical protein